MQETRGTGTGTGTGTAGTGTSARTSTSTGTASKVTFSNNGGAGEHFLPLAFLLAM
ncbi:MAG: hypothetical protein HZA10_10510 [Nitrospirae bacterium]|nr:hypothetical protein [Nitrospirota bacterium]